MFTFIVYDGNEYLTCHLQVESIEHAQAMMPPEHEIIFAMEGEQVVVDSEGIELQTFKMWC